MQPERKDAVERLQRVLRPALRREDLRVVHERLLPTCVQTGGAVTFRHPWFGSRAPLTRIGVQLGGEEGVVIEAMVA